MKLFKKRYRVLGLLIVLLLSSCLMNNERNSAGKSIKAVASDCKFNQTESNVNVLKKYTGDFFEEYPKRVQVSSVSNDSSSILFKNVLLNCGAKYRYSYSVDGDTFSVISSDVGTSRAMCFCPFDLSFTVTKADFSPKIINVYTFDGEEYPKEGSRNY